MENSMTTLYENEDFWEGRGDAKMKNASDGKGEDKSVPQGCAESGNHPPRYCAGGVECIEGIRAALGDEFPAYCQGNVLKYVWRWKHKGGLEDLKKAQVYLRWMIATVEGEKK